MLPIKDKNISISASEDVLKPFAHVPANNISTLVNTNINNLYPEEALSTNPDDYLFISVPIFDYMKPNANGISYLDKNNSAKSLQTAIGKPVIVNHDINDAIILGIVVDAIAADDAAYTLLAIDMSKPGTKQFVKYLEDVPSAEFSISTYSTNYCCSECGAPVEVEYNGKQQ